MMKTSILITGASGFVGAAALRHLQAQGFAPRPVFRSAASAQAAGWDASKGAAIVPDISAQSDWAAALAGVEVVLHCAARAHIMRDEALDPLAEYRRVNVQGTLRLAEQAAAAGVRRFVFISSIKVNGESTVLGQPYRADAPPAPEDAYGQSKAEAEAGLQAIAAKTRMELVIIRPPLVYGPGVKGNFASMLRWMGKGVPLPLAAASKNRRSLVALDNLLDFIATCIQHPKAAGEVFLVSDGDDCSTAGLLRSIARAQGRSARLLWLPVDLLQLAANLLGKGGVAQRLLGSLQVDISKNRQLLDWQPPIGLDEGLRRAGQKET